ncbi:MAG TPA: peptidoglycan-binding domain-containing protein [Acidisarcina sp.]|nr:peptidoglycan-binding domain-containing protein [Acidisarcina sp.]
MFLLRASLSLTLLIALAAPATYASHYRHAPTGRHSRTTATTSHKSKKPKISKVRGQRQIDPDRAREIQLALIHENYLSGEPSGQWDAETQDAMRRFQADHGWQTKIMPDSRALIKLGLGPSNPGGSRTVPDATTLDATPRPQDTSSLLDESNTLSATRSQGR